jgi:Domain of unknown function (DUF1707)
MIKSVDQVDSTVAEGVVGLIAIAFMFMYFLAVFGALVATPVWVAVELRRAYRRRLRPARGRAAEELREQYAAGVLTLAGLEDRLETTLRATTHFEVENVLADLPARRRPSRVAVFEAAAGVAVLLLLHAAAARAAGAALALGAVAPPLRWRPLLTAFLAGVALLAAPLAALPLAASAGWRWVART